MPGRRTALTGIAASAVLPPLPPGLGREADQSRGEGPRRLAGAITDVPGLRVGHFTDPRRPTGCSVVIAEDGAVGGVDVRGAAPGTRETDLLDPSNLVEKVPALAAELDRATQFVASIVALDPAAAIRRVPVLRRDYLAGAIIEPHCMEVDVNGLHQGFLRGAKARGASVRLKAPVEAIERKAGRWVAVTPAGSVSAPAIVNAAGAWADEVAALAGIAPVRLEPRRRTAFNIPAPPGHDITAWPLVNDVGEEFYFKPEAGQLFVSPADATPSAPLDAHPDDLDVAIGADRLERATTIRVRRVSHAWAGLRTFAADASPVVGPDETAEGFVWLAGQGGYGIKTSPALSRACVSLIRTGRLPSDLEDLGLSPADLLPERLRRLAPKPTKDVHA